MTADEILGCARQAASFGYGTVVLQAGEDGGIERQWMADLIRQIKALPGAHGQALAVTLSLGERTPDELAPGNPPAPTAICCDSRRPTASFTTAFTRPWAPRGLTASRCLASFAKSATKPAAV